MLANNVETLANVPGIVSQGADWFRTLGTSDSPGTVVCTVSGDTRRAGVAEFPMGTTIAEIVDEIGGGALDDRRIVAAISGVANAILPVELFDTPACYDALRSVGSGLGAAGFIVFDDRADLIAVAEGVSRFLAVESCGQCEPCKRDGLAVATALDDLRRSESDGDVEAIVARLARDDHRRRPLLPRHPAPGGRDEHPRPVPRICSPDTSTDRCRRPTVC